MKFERKRKKEEMENQKRKRKWKTVNKESKILAKEVNILHISGG
jgi:hypothetical protein